MNKKSILHLEKIEGEHFNKLAEKYDINYQYNDPFVKYKISKKVRDFVKSVKKNIKGNKLKILEIGCGTGEYTKEIANIFKTSSVVGIDISEKIINSAKKKCRGVKNVKLLVNSAYDTKFNDESFDVICGFYVLHHLNINVLKNEIKRLLKPSGIAYFCEPNLLNPVVYIIKSNKWLKSAAGDSPNESAINPLTIKELFNNLRLSTISLSEYIWPLNFFSTKQLIYFDKSTQWLNKIPLLKYLGGSVQLLLKKY